MNPEDDLNMLTNDESGFPPEPVELVQSIVLVAHAVSDKNIISPAVNTAIAENIRLIGGLNQIRAKAAGDVRPLRMPRLDIVTGRSRAKKYNQGNASTKLLVDIGPKLQAVTYSREA